MRRLRGEAPGGATSPSSHQRQGSNSPQTSPSRRAGRTSPSNAAPAPGTPNVGQSSRAASPLGRAGGGGGSPLRKRSLLRRKSSLAAISAMSSSPRSGSAHPSAGGATGEDGIRRLRSSPLAPDGGGTGPRMTRAARSLLSPRPSWATAGFDRLCRNLRDGPSAHWHSTPAASASGHIVPASFAAPAGKGADWLARRRAQLRRVPALPPRGRSTFVSPHDAAAFVARGVDSGEPRLRVDRALGGTVHAPGAAKPAGPSEGRVGHLSAAARAVGALSLDTARRRQGRGGDSTDTVAEPWAMPRPPPPPFIYLHQPLAAVGESPPSPLLSRPAGSRGAGGDAGEAADEPPDGALHMEAAARARGRHRLLEPVVPRRRRWSAPQTRREGIAVEASLQGQQQEGGGGGRGESTGSPTEADIEDVVRRAGLSESRAERDERLVAKAVRGTRFALASLRARLHKLTRSDLELLMAVMGNVAFFRDLPHSLQVQLAPTLTFVEVMAETWVCREGDDAFSFYVCLAGSLRVRLADRPGWSRVLGPGSAFGELALLNRTTRSASVIAETDAVLASVDADDYHATLARYEREKQEAQALEIARIPCLAPMRPQLLAWLQETRLPPSLLHFLSLFSEATPHTGAVLYREGDVATEVYFVLEGSVAVRKGMYALSPAFAHARRNAPTGGSQERLFPWRLRQSQRAVRYQRRDVALLTGGDFFGDERCLGASAAPPGGAHGAHGHGDEEAAAEKPVEGEETAGEGRQKGRRGGVAAGAGATVMDARLEVAEGGTRLLRLSSDAARRHLPAEVREQMRVYAEGKARWRTRRLAELSRHAAAPTAQGAGAGGEAPARVPATSPGKEDSGAPPAQPSHGEEEGRGDRSPPRPAAHRSTPVGGRPPLRFRAEPIHAEARVPPPSGGGPHGSVTEEEEEERRRRQRGVAVLASVGAQPGARGVGNAAPSPGAALLSARESSPPGPQVAEAAAAQLDTALRSELEAAGGAASLGHGHGGMTLEQVRHARETAREAFAELADTAASIPRPECEALGREAARKARDIATSLGLSDHVARRAVDRAAEALGVSAGADEGKAGRRGRPSATLRSLERQFHAHQSRMRGSDVGAYARSGAARAGLHASGPNLRAAGRSVVSGPRPPPTPTPSSSGPATPIALASPPPRAKADEVPRGVASRAEQPLHQAPGREARRRGGLASSLSSSSPLLLPSAAAYAAAEKGASSWDVTRVMQQARGPGGVAKDGLEPYGDGIGEAMRRRARAFAARQPYRWHIGRRQAGAVGDAAIRDQADRRTALLQHMLVRGAESPGPEGGYQ